MNNENKCREIQILIIENNTADIRLIREHFKDDRMVNHRLNVVSDANEAIKYLKKEGEYADKSEPDLILLDLFLLKMDGREILKVIRKDPKFSDKLVCLMTFTESEAEALNVENQEATFYILKPVDVEKFLSLLKKAENYLPEELKILSKLEQDTLL